MIDAALLHGVTQIANAICKRKGYTIRIDESEVEIVMEALLRLRAEMEAE